MWNFLLVQFHHRSLKCYFSFLLTWHFMSSVSVQRLGEMWNKDFILLLFLRLSLCFCPFLFVISSSFVPNTPGFTHQTSNYIQLSAFLPEGINKVSFNLKLMNLCHRLLYLGPLLNWVDFLFGLWCDVQCSEETPLLWVHNMLHAGYRDLTNGALVWVTSQ